MGQHARLTIDADITPKFTACYLRTAGDQCAFIEAHTAHALPKLLASLEQHGRKPEEVRWIVITHAHLDHAAGASALLAKCPNATLLAHPRTAKNLISPERLIEGATAVYGEARFRELYGVISPISAERVKSLDDGASFELGDATLTVWHTAGHAFHHFIVDDPATDSVFTGDTFGLVYPALQGKGRFAIPSTSPTGFHAAEARKSIDKVLSLGRRFVCPTHFDAYEDSDVIAAQLKRFIDRAEAWVEEEAASDETEKDIELRLRAAWHVAISEEAPHFGDQERALLGLDIELNAQGLAYAAVASRSKPAKPLRVALGAHSVYVLAMMSNDGPPGFPYLLNERDAQGRIILIDDKGAAYVDRGWPSDGPSPTGIQPGVREDVTRPTSMSEALFDEHPHRQLWASSDGARVLALYWYGNPPPPSPVVTAPLWVRTRLGIAAADSFWTRLTRRFRLLCLECVQTK
ncbi:MAG: MBL fold metallo-hydrolase [Polyangiaceae bacterium]